MLEHLPATKFDSTHNALLSLDNKTLFLLSPLRCISGTGSSCLQIVLEVAEAVSFSHRQKQMISYLVPASSDLSFWPPTRAKTVTCMHLPRMCHVPGALKVNPQSNPITWAFSLPLLWGIGNWRLAKLGNSPKSHSQHTAASEFEMKSIWVQSLRSYMLIYITCGPI